MWELQRIFTLTQCRQISTETFQFQQGKFEALLKDHEFGIYLLMLVGGSVEESFDLSKF